MGDGEVERGRKWGVEGAGGNWGGGGGKGGCGKWGGG